MTGDRSTPVWRRRVRRRCRRPWCRARSWSTARRRRRIYKPGRRRRKRSTGRSESAQASDGSDGGQCWREFAWRSDGLEIFDEVGLFLLGEPRTEVTIVVVHHIGERGEADVV